MEVDKAFPQTLCDSPGPGADASLKDFDRDALDLPQEVAGLSHIARAPLST